MIRMELIAENAHFPPGVRFSPTDEELIMHYLKKKVQGETGKLPEGPEHRFVVEVDIYRYHPEDLRGMAFFKKELNWYFYCPLEKKYVCGIRANRATKSGFWKATGKPRLILNSERKVGKVQTLVFHQGKPKNAERTDWVMHEYSLADAELENQAVSNAFVLCKIFKKSGMGPGNGDQYGAPYNKEEWEMSNNATAMPVVSASVVTDSAVINGSVATTSAVIGGSVSTNAYPLDTPEQIFSGDVSVSAVVDEPPTLTSDSAIFVSTSKGAVPVYVEGVGQAPDTILEANPVPNDADGMFCDELDEYIVDEFGNPGITLDEGKTPKGERTDWVMHEYRLKDGKLDAGVHQDAFVLCKIFKKSGRGCKNGDQYGAPYVEEEYDAPMVPAAYVQDQITSVNDSFFGPVCPQKTSVQVHSSAASVSVTGEAPAPTSNASNVASTSKSSVQNDDYYYDGDDDIDIWLRNFHTDEDEFRCVLPPP